MDKKAIKRIIRNILFFVVLMTLTFLLLFKDQDMGELLNLIRGANKVYIIIGIGLMFGYFLMEATNILIILKSFGNKISIFKALKFTLIGYFFSAITPAATGGQPMEVYYMAKENIPVVNSTLALLIQLCGFQISTISYGIICAILNPSILSGGLIWLFILGITINGIALLLMLTCIFSEKLTKKIINLVIKILSIFKIKNLNSIQNKINEGLKKYSISSRYIKEHKNIFKIAIIRTLIQIMCYHLVAYFVYRSFGLNNISIWKMFMMQSVLYSMVSGLPLPGAIGISETIFIHIYRTIYPEKILNGAMLLNRGITFYWFVILSLFVVLYNSFKEKKLNR